MLQRICGRCGRMVKQGEQCPCISSRHKEYDRAYRDERAAKVYHSKEWKGVKAFVMNRAAGLDEYEYATTGRMIQADIVHHIEPLRADMSRAFDTRNLIAVSSKSHKRIHDTYAKGDKERKELQAVLFSIVGDLEKGKRPPGEGQKSFS